MNFTGKTALISGASVGIGRATALTLAKKGAKVALLDVNFEKLEKVKKEIGEYSREALVYDCDVSDEKRVNEVVSEIISKFGRVDILVNNAGIWRSFDSFLDTPTDAWRRFIDVNLMSAVYLTRAVLPQMIENGWGRIINVASVAGVYGNANMVHYSATKGAMISMTKALAKEVADKGITVNSVSPGSVNESGDSDINASEKSELSFMGRTGTNAENANLIAFLASDEAAYICGQNILIDGCRRKL